MSKIEFSLPIFILLHFKLVIILNGDFKKNSLVFLEINSYEPFFIFTIERSLI